MVEQVGFRTIRIAFVPKHMNARMALHSGAAATGAACALRMGYGGPWWGYVAWYLGSFVGFHFVLIPFLAAWLMMQMRVERWIRSLVEQELIRFDLQTYKRQFERVFPAASEAPPDDQTPHRKHDRA